MPLVLPNIDDRTYQQLVDEALARIPVHNPEWTNFNDSDPGVTLIQLFAFMTESLLYRANLIPERNRVKFLQLLGVPLRAAEAARGIVTFSNPRGPLTALTLQAGLEVSAGQVPFRTQDGLDVLPIEARVYYKSPIEAEDREEVEDMYEQLYVSFTEGGSTLDYYETKQLEAPSTGTVFPVVELGEDTLDGAIWVALLARSKELVETTREAIAHKVLTLGILPALTDATRVLLPGGNPTTEGEGRLVFELPDMSSGTELPTEESQRVARYRPVVDTRPSTDLLKEPGVVQLTLPDREGLRLWTNLEPLELGTGDFPPYIEDAALLDRVVTWIRIRLPEATAGAPSQQLSARFSWLDANAARVTQRAKVNAESPGRGNGEPDQRFSLVNTPVIPDSVRLTVGGELWYRIDDLLSAEPEVPVRSPRLVPSVPTPAVDPAKVKVYSLDRESGEVRFGDGAHGSRPPSGAVIQVSYDYGGGRQGNVGIGAISKGPTLPAGVKVTNPIPTWGGDEAQTVDEAIREIPRYLQHRDRLVSASDFEEITWQTPGVDLGRVDVLSLFHPEIPDVLSEGVVTVMVIPKYDPVSPETPEPDRLFLDTVCRYLDPRRVVTTEVHVRGPEYVGLYLSIGIDVVPGTSVAPVREAVRAAVRTFLSPFTGGFDGRGWPLNKTVEGLEVWAVATRVEGVAKVTGVVLGDETGGEIPRLELTGLQLPRVLGVEVAVGEPLPITDLTGGTTTTPTTAPKVVPVPVVPPEC